MDYETWLLDTGGDVIEKKNAAGADALSDYEKLIYYFWVLDYSIRNAGDLEAGFEVDEAYYDECLKLAVETGAGKLAGLLENGDQILHIYFDSFDAVCGEVRELAGK